jgi:predicted RNase H-like nuclease (RuvC/YqgF family)
VNRAQLSQLNHLNREIESLKRQIESLEPEFTTDSVKGSGVSFPYTQHTIIIRGIGYKEHEAKIKRLKNQLSRRVSELMDLVEEINGYIGKIDDSEIRQIISLRYVNGFTWQQVAAHMGANGDGSTERKKHDRFLKISLNS